jgi:outer membrane protein TolC
MRAAGLVIGAGLLLSVGCTVGPKYKRPLSAAPPAFKEQPPLNFKEAEAAGWKQSQPGDAFLKGRWWEVYNDSALNALEEQVSISNQNVLAAAARYREAKAQIRVARSALFPTASTFPAMTVTGRGTGSAASSSSQGAGAAGSTRTTFNLPFDVSWEPDIWGSLRRGVTASSATAQSFAADLENARLLYQLTALTQTQTC